MSSGDNGVLKSWAATGLSQLSAMMKLFLESLAVLNGQVDHGWLP